MARHEISAQTNPDARAHAGTRPSCERTKRNIQHHLAQHLFAMSLIVGTLERLTPDQRDQRVTLLNDLNQSIRAAQSMLHKVTDSPSATGQAECS